MASRRETQEVGRVTSFNGLRWNLNENLALRRPAIASEMESKSVLIFFFCFTLKAMQPSRVDGNRLDGRVAVAFAFACQLLDGISRKAAGACVALAGRFSHCMHGHEGRDGILSFCGSISGSQSNARELSTGHTHMLHAVVTRFSSEIRHMAIYIHVRYARGR